jgi:serine/threonine protein kinase
VASALHYLSAEGWVHLDVKPDNIVMGVPPRLIDLSIARTVERAASLRSPIGTDPYMAPEQCDPDSHPAGVGKPADVWGLGATLYRAVAGRRPFPRPDGAGDSDDPAHRFPQIAEDPAPLPDSVPGELASLLGRTLAKRPEDRPTAGEVVLELEPLVDELPRKLAFGRRGTQFR